MMELWVEYLKRHNLPIIRPQEPFLEEVVNFHISIPTSPPVEYRVWAFFLMNNSHIIARHSYELEDQINQWCDGLLFVIRRKMPSLNEQQKIIFKQIPYLETMWNSWLNHTHLFTSDALPIAQLQLYNPNQRHS